MEQLPGQSLAPQQPQASPASNQPLRTINVDDVVKALEIAAKRLGNVDRTCATLRSWAEQGRVTPAGQLLTVKVVSKAIEIWLDPTKSKKTEVACDRQLSIPTPQSLKRPQEQVATTPDPKKQKRQTYEEGKRERLEEERKAKELTAQRVDEVLKEILGHMEEIIRRSHTAAPTAVDEWRSAPTGCDRRELYQRLVHAEQDADVQIPEELCAELLPHQVEGLEWLASLYVNGLHGILADEMGLGKTIQTISLILYIQERKGNLGPHLIVAPKSCLSNWQIEFKRFAPKYVVYVLTGDERDREKTLRSIKNDIAQGRAAALVTNYEQVYRNEWLTQNVWQLIVVDEGHRLKNPDTIIHGAMAQLQCRMRLLLTGTPLQNGLNELWALLHYLLPDLFTCMMDFKAWFAKPFAGIQGLNEFSVQLEPEQEQQVIQQMHSLLSPFLLQRLKSEVLADKLPPRVELICRVPLSAWQRQVYKDLEQKTIKLLGNDDSVSSEQVNNALMQLRKIALHPFLFQETYKCDENLYRTSGKVEALDRLLSKLLRFNHKVLIFSQFTTVLDILQNFLKWRAISCVRLDGSVPQEQRRERIACFDQDPKLMVFLLSARAGSLGLNLQAADTVVLFDLDWNPQNDKQAVARVHRVGQTQEVRVIRLVTDSAVERHMEQRCQEKLEMEEKIMGAGMFRKAATVDQRRQALRAVLGLGGSSSPPASSSATGGVAAAAVEEDAADLTPPEEANRQLARSPEELAAFAAIDEKLLRPQKGARRDAPLLVRCGRLMCTEEVPQGFQALTDND